MKEIKKQQIVNIAIDLFAQHGIANVSFASIAKVLGASKGKIYHYFPDGKSDLVDEILQIFENCVSSSIPDKKMWESKDLDVNTILYDLFFEFPVDDILQIRKILRIIMAEMYHNEQIARHATTHLITKREKMLADYFEALATSGKIPLLDADSVARCLNRVIMVYRIENALHYSFGQHSAELDAQTARMICDCTNIIQSMITKADNLTLFKQKTEFTSTLDT